MVKRKIKVRHHPTSDPDGVIHELQTQIHAIQKTIRATKNQIKETEQEVVGYRSLLGTQQERITYLKRMIKKKENEKGRL